MDPKANYLTLQILLLRVDIIPVLNIKYNNTKFYNEEFLRVVYVIVKFDTIYTKL